MITVKDLKNLSMLARIKISTAEEKSLLKDLRKILEHFRILTRLKTGKITPLSGAGFVKNVFRSDVAAETDFSQLNVDQFPEKEKGFLKVPPIFE